MQYHGMLGILGPCQVADLYQCMSLTRSPTYFLPSMIPRIRRFIGKTDFVSFTGAVDFLSQLHIQ
jgi:hypothetical protein